MDTQALGVLVLIGLLSLLVLAAIIVMFIELLKDLFE